MKEWFRSLYNPWDPGCIEEKGSHKVSDKQQENDVVKKQNMNMRPKSNGKDSVRTGRCDQRIGYNGVAQARLVEEKRDKRHWS